MKKLIISRFLAMLAFIFTAVAAAVVLYASGFNSLEGAIGNKVIDICHSTGIIAMCLLYFFAGKKFYEVSIKKLLLVFFIWTVAVFSASIFINPYLTYLSGGYSWFPAYINNILGFTKNPYLSGIIGFFVEMAIIILGIYTGRIKAGKTEGKYSIYLSKFCGIIIAFIISCMVRGLFVILSKRAPMGYLSKEGVRLGWIISMLPVSLWYIYAGFKSFRTNLKITLPVVLLWDALGVFLWYIFKSWKLLAVNGGYFAFLEGICYITEDRYLLLSFIVAYILEVLFITAGVLLGRYFNKRKALKGENPKEIVSE